MAAKYFPAVLVVIDDQYPRGADVCVQVIPDDDDVYIYPPGEFHPLQFALTKKFPVLSDATLYQYPEGNGVFVHVLPADDDM